jgi:RimJ/RimL family protein N-acetyltransferase
MARLDDAGTGAARKTALETERLLLRVPEERDLDGFLELVSDPEVMRFIGNGRAGDRATAERSLARTQAHWAADGYGQLVIERREDGRFLGRTGVLVWDSSRWAPSTQADAGDRAEVELGWAIVRAAWGEGYATEAARAARDWAFAAADPQRLISLIDPANARSIAVAERLGARPEGEVRVRGSTRALLYVHPRP